MEEKDNSQQVSKDETKTSPEGRGIHLESLIFGSEFFEEASKSKKAEASTSNKHQQPQNSITNPPTKKQGKKAISEISHKESKKKGLKLRVKKEEEMLGEEEYTEIMSKIIKRDYFPDLLRLEAYEEYIKGGKESNVRIPSLLVKYSQYQANNKDKPIVLPTGLNQTHTHNQNVPSQYSKFDDAHQTPLQKQSQQSHNNQSPKKSKINISHYSLDQYLNSYKRYFFI
jgi:hypothetical protein